MHTMTYAQLRDPLFFQAIQKVAHATTIKSPKILLSVAKIYSACHDSWKESDAIHTKLIEQFGLKDDTGAIKRVEGQDRVVLDPATVAEYYERDKEFQALEVTFDRPKIPLDALAELDLSPLDVKALMPFLEYSEEEA